MALDALLLAIILAPAIAMRNDERVKWRDWYPLFGVLAFPGLHAVIVPAVPTGIGTLYIVGILVTVPVLPLALITESDLRATKLWSWFWSLPHHVLLLFVALFVRSEQ